MSNPVNCGTTFCSCIECVDPKAEEFDSWCKESDDGAEEKGFGKIEVCPGVTLDQFKAALKESDDGAA